MKVGKYTFEPIPALIGGAITAWGFHYFAGCNFWGVIAIICVTMVIMVIKGLVEGLGIPPIKIFAALTALCIVLTIAVSIAGPEELLLNESISIPIHDGIVTVPEGTPVTVVSRQADGIIVKTEAQQFQIRPSQATDKHVAFLIGIGFLWGIYFVIRWLWEAASRAIAGDPPRFGPRPCPRCGYPGCTCHTRGGRV